MLDLDKKVSLKVTVTSRTTVTPKSIRFSTNEISDLEKFKQKVMDMTNTDKCSDTKVMHLAIKIANLSRDKIIRKALSEML